MQFLLELLVQPLFEFAFYGIGYATAYVIVPIFTFGQVTVEPGRDGKLLKPKRGRIQRASNGKYTMEAELAAFVGVLFWIVVAVGVYVLEGA